MLVSRRLALACGQAHARVTATYLRHADATARFEKVLDVAPAFGEGEFGLDERSACEKRGGRGGLRRLEREREYFERHVAEFD